MSLFDIEARVRQRSPLAWRIYTRMQQANVSFMAGSVAYGAFMSLLPLLVAVFLLVALVAGETLATAVLAVTESVLPPETSRVLASALTSQTGGATSIISIVLVVWSSLGLFEGIDTAFSMIYGTEDTNSRLDQVVDGLIAFGVILVAVVAAVGTASLGVLSDLPLVGLFSSVGLVAGLTVAFFPMYYRFPDTDISAREALPGAVVAATGWTLLQAVFQVYVRFVADATISGALGAILVLLTWLYFGSYIVLFGAVVNVAVATDD